MQTRLEELEQSRNEFERTLITDVRDLHGEFDNLQRQTVAKAKYLPFAEELHQVQAQHTKFAGDFTEFNKKYEQFVRRDEEHERVKKLLEDSLAEHRADMDDFEERYQWMREHCAQQTSDVAALRTHLHDEVSWCKSLVADVRDDLTKTQEESISKFEQAAETMRSDMDSARKELHGELHGDLQKMLIKLEEATDERFTAEANGFRERLVLVSGELAEKIALVGAAAKREMEAHLEKTRKAVADGTRSWEKRLRDLETVVHQEILEERLPDVEESISKAVDELRAKQDLDKEAMEDLHADLDTRFADYVRDATAEVGALRTDADQTRQHVEEVLERRLEEISAEAKQQHDTVTEIVEQRHARITTRLTSSSRALHLLQKLMCRPDGAQLFLEFDTDGDGTVSREELKEGYAKIGEHLSEEDMDAIMALVDQDGDGAIGYGEFVQMGKMTEDVEALRMTMQANLAQLKAESEETMVQKIIPLEESLATTRKDLEHTMSHTIAEIENTIEDISTDLNAQMETLRFDMHGTTPYRAYLLRFVSSC